MSIKNEQELENAAGQDLTYQQLLTACREFEPKYEQIRAKLSKDDREQLDQYIALCEELDHRRIWLALHL